MAYAPNCLGLQRSDVLYTTYALSSNCSLVITSRSTMPFITDLDLDRLMGRHAPRGGAFAALLCLAQLAPDAPAPLEILVQALNAWWDDQQDDLMTMLEGLEERDRVIVADRRAGTII